MRNFALVVTSESKENRFIDYFSFLDKRYSVKKIKIQDNEIKTDANLVLVDLNVFYEEGKYESILGLLENTTSKIAFIDIYEKRLLPPFFLRYLLDYATEKNVDAAYFMFDKLPGPICFDETRVESAKNKFEKDIGNFIEIMLKHHNTDSMLEEAVKKIPNTHLQFSNYNIKHKI